MAHAEIEDDLWNDFHAEVNMTSRELRDWLATDASGAEDEAFPDQAGDDRSRAVLAILGKRRTDLTTDDVAVMRSVIEEVRTARDEDRDAAPGDSRWRHRLMSIGHDPLKP